MKITTTLLLLLTTLTAPSLAQLPTQDIRIRDPFIYTDPATETYYIYAQAANRAGSEFTGVEVYTSKDLKTWTAPTPVLTLPDTMGIHAVWAPEMHAYNDKFYLFVTLTFKELLPIDKPVNRKSWPRMHRRGTHVFVADSPAGPFTALKEGPHTPADWMAFDGTLWVEEDTPYMIFCHEWVQTIDGTMDLVQVTPDLADTVGTPIELFKGSHAPGVDYNPERGNVTDGCYLYRSPKSGKLFMIWSTFVPGNGYCVLLTQSSSGKVKGPWKNHEIIYGKNGGHGMLFQDFSGNLILSLHQPNTNNKERLHLFPVEDTGDTLRIGPEITK